MIRICMLPWFELNTISLGPIPIQVWGFWVALGVVVGVVILTRRLARFGVPKELPLDLAIAITVGGFIGARLFHVVFYEPQFFIGHPWEVFKIWHGGLSSYGGFVGAAVGFFLFAQKQKFKQIKRRVSIPGLFDELSFAALFAWMVGRVGCVMIHDHLGIYSNRQLAFAKPDGPRLDMAFLEIVGLVPLALFFLWSRKKKLPEGVWGGVLFVYYGMLRFILDFFRATDIANSDARYWGLTPAQYLSILMLILGTRILIRATRKKVQ